MLSLGLGIVAALAWGVHDLCVRYVSQNAGIIAPLLGVMVFGTLMVAPFSLLAEPQPTTGAVTLGLVAGVIYGLAGYALYQAFSIGPVRLVAPIIGSYPALSVAWAGVTGQAATLDQWVAVLLIIVGVGFGVGRSDEDGQPQGRRRAAVLWSLAAGVSFATTFAIGQAAASGGAEVALLLPTRLAALGTIIALAVLIGQSVRPGKKTLPVLVLMGALDALALGMIIVAGGVPRPEFASVAASAFGLITVTLAALFLRERMTPAQWGAVGVVFASIAYLGL
ncbi:EamA family transporter [Shimia sp. MMG029]|uniref:EamA family transporter n=1 Tax=Shimia sp. MMG029 TaxID=3021978 RepID=UPI0022FE8944|nr:EamA family transporter [Shimia sp. MMG029]MDA5558947.1 EamA family transporter [Shimia sp. MMG029]